MNQYVDWQSLKRTKVQDITPGDVVCWFIDGNAQLAVVLKINHDLKEYDLYGCGTSLPVTTLCNEIVTTCPCISLIRVVDNLDVLQST